MRVYIGDDVLLDGGKKVHVQDVDLLQLIAKVGKVDTNGHVWEWEWVSFKRLTHGDGKGF